MFSLSFIKCNQTVAKILQIAGIISGYILTFSFGNILFGIVISLFTIAFVFSLLSVNKAVSVSNSANTTNCDDCKTHLSDLENYLDTSVRNKIHVIPVLTDQLQAVINQTDEAAGSLTEAFIGISRQAKQQLQSVQVLFGNLSEQSTENNILTLTQKNLQEIRSNFSVLTSFFDKSIKMISEVFEQLSKVDAFTVNIENIQKMTNILALNASIEAAHTGAAGSGFKVIASEINALSRNSNESIKEISGITENLTSKVKAIKDELETVYKESKSIESRTDILFNMTTDKISSTLADTAKQIKNIAGDAEILTKEISKVVVSIQFQDITRQQIEHVISPLETLNKDFIESIDNLKKNDFDISKSSNAPVIDSLMDQYTMESEREILKKHSNQNI